MIILRFLYACTCSLQGCQIFPGTTYQNGKIYTKMIPRYTKWPQIYQMEEIPNDHKYIKWKIYQMTTNIPNGRYTEWPNGSNIDEMSFKFTNIFQFKALLSLPKLPFFVWKFTIWQHWQCTAQIGKKIHFCGCCQFLKTIWGLKMVKLVALTFLAFLCKKSNAQSPGKL
jgi:hypothetical protein